MSVQGSSDTVIPTLLSFQDRCDHDWLIRSLVRIVRIGSSMAITSPTEL